MSTKFREIYTSQSLSQGDWEHFLPEYYALKATTENSAWHKQQNVFDHVVAVVRGLENTLTLPFLSESQKQTVTDYLNETVDTHTHEDLLWVATLLHDISKSHIWFKEGDAVRCPGHEYVSTAMVPQFADRFNLDEQELNEVIAIVRWHGFISDILQVIVNQPESTDRYWQLFESVVGSVNVPLALLMRADLLGSDLNQSNPNLFETLISVLEMYLKNQADLALTK